MENKQTNGIALENTSEEEEYNPVILENKPIATIKPALCISCGEFHDYAYLIGKTVLCTKCIEKIILEYIDKNMDFGYWKQ